MVLLRERLGKKFRRNNIEGLTVLRYIVVSEIDSYDFLIDRRYRIA